MKLVINVAHSGKEYREFFSFEKYEYEGKETVDETNNNAHYVTCKKDESS